MDVIMADQVERPSITSREYMPGMNGVVVSTRVPASLFDFRAGSSITVTGGVGMGFVENYRKLLAAGSVRKLDENAPYEVNVQLVNEVSSDKDGSLNSAARVLSMGVVTLGLTFVFM